MKPTKLIPKGYELKLLKSLHKIFVEVNGHLPHKLDEHKFYATSIFEDIRVDLHNGEIWYPTLELLKTLEKRGLVRFEENRLEFFLTEKGFKEAEISVMGKFLMCLNRNPGVIASAALFISILLPLIQYLLKEPTSMAKQEKVIQGESRAVVAHPPTLQHLPTAPK